MYLSRQDASSLRPIGMYFAILGQTGVLNRVQIFALIFQGQTLSCHYMLPVMHLDPGIQALLRIMFNQACSLSACFQRSMSHCTLAAQ